MSTSYHSWDELKPPALRPTLETIKELTEVFALKDEGDVWKYQFKALSDLQSIVKFEAPVLKAAVNNSSLIFDLIVSLVCSLRSQLAKNALMTLTALSKGLKNSMISDLMQIDISKMSHQLPTPTTSKLDSKLKTIGRFDVVVSILLQKASSTTEKKFINDEAWNALLGLSDLEDAFLLLVASSCKIILENKSSSVIEKAAKLLLHLLEKDSSSENPSSGIYGGGGGGREEVVGAYIARCVPRLTNDRLSTSRQAARTLVAIIQKRGWVSKKLWESIINEISNMSLKQAVEKVISNSVTPIVTISSGTATRSRSTKFADSTISKGRQLPPLKSSAVVRSSSYTLAKARSQQFTQPASFDFSHLHTGGGRAGGPPPLPRGGRPIAPPQRSLSVHTRVPPVNRAPNIQLQPPQPPPRRSHSRSFSAALASPANSCSSPSILKARFASLRQRDIQSRQPPVVPAWLNPVRN